jgi:TldD protein
MTNFEESYIDHLKGVISRIPCAYAELRISSSDRTNINLSGKITDAITSGNSLSGSIRILDTGSWGFITFNDIQNIPKYAKSIKEISSRLDRRHDTGLVRAKPKVVHTKTTVQRDPVSVSLDEKYKLISSYNDILQDHSKIQTTRAVYKDVRSHEIFINTEGAELIFDKSFCGVTLVAIAKDGSSIETYHESQAGYGGFELVENLEADAETVVKTAVELLDAEDVEGGKYSVIVDPRLAGVFVHEAFGHLSEADFVYENERMKKIMTLGSKFGRDELNVVDDGNVPFVPGYIPLDDEGTEPQKTYLIKNGKLSGRLHSKETAFKMNEKLTGNARAITTAAQPIVRMTNTFIENGPYSKEEIFDSMDDGIYAVNAFGGQTNLEMFTFSSAYGRIVKDGKPGKMVKNVMLSGNVFETLKNIEMIGNDMKLFGGLGGCGKGGQGPLPVSFGGPHMRINNVLIGGKQ